MTYRRTGVCNRDARSIKNISCDDDFIDRPLLRKIESSRTVVERAQLKERTRRVVWRIYIRVNECKSFYDTAPKEAECRSGARSLRLLTDQAGQLCAGAAQIHAFGKYDSIAGGKQLHAAIHS